MSKNNEPRLVTHENFFDFFREAINRLGDEEGDKLCDYFHKRRIESEIAKSQVYMVEDKTIMTKRKTGYYRVKRVPDRNGETEWEVAYYEILFDRSIWTMMWFDDEFLDNAFIEIDEERILMPDER